MIVGFDLDSIQPHDPCGTLLLAGVSAWFGRIVVRRPEISDHFNRNYRLGVFFGVVAFLGVVGVGLRDGQMPVVLLILATSVTGFTLAGAWVGLTVLSVVTTFLHRSVSQLRWWMLRAWIRWRTPPVIPPSAEELERRRERAERLAEERTRREEAKLHSAESARKRCEKARIRAEFFFNLHAPELGARFTRKMFNDFANRFLTEQQSPEDIEARVKELMSVIHQHLAKTKPLSERQSLDDLLATYAARRKKVQESSLDARDQKTMLIALDEQQEQDVRKAIREGRI